MPCIGRRRWQTVGGEEGEGRKEGRETEKEMMGGDDDHDERDTKKNKKPRQQLLLQQEKEKEAVWTTGTALESNSGPAIKPRAQLFNLSTTNTISSSSFSFEPLGVADVPSEAISAPAAAAAGMVPLSDRSEARTMGLTALSPPPVAQFFICPSNGQNGDEDADGRLEGWHGNGGDDLREVTPNTNGEVMRKEEGGGGGMGIVPVPFASVLVDDTAAPVMVGGGTRTGNEMVESESLSIRFGVPDRWSVALSPRLGSRFESGSSTTETGTGSGRGIPAAAAIADKEATRTPHPAQVPPTPDANLILSVDPTRQKEERNGPFKKDTESTRSASFSYSSSSSSSSSSSDDIASARMEKVRLQQHGDETPLERPQRVWDNASPLAFVGPYSHAENKEGEDDRDRIGWQERECHPVAPAPAVSAVPAPQIELDLELEGSRLMAVCSESGSSRGIEREEGRDLTSLAAAADSVRNGDGDGGVNHGIRRANSNSNSTIPADAIRKNEDGQLTTTRARWTTKMGIDSVSEAVSVGETDGRVSIDRRKSQKWQWVGGVTLDGPVLPIVGVEEKNGRRRRRPTKLALSSADPRTRAVFPIDRPSIVAHVQGCKDGRTMDHRRRRSIAVIDDSDEGWFNDIDGQDRSDRGSIPSHLVGEGNVDGYTTSRRHGDTPADVAQRAMLDPIRKRVYSTGGGEGRDEVDSRKRREDASRLRRASLGSMSAKRQYGRRGWLKKGRKGGVGRVVFKQSATATAPSADADDPLTITMSVSQNAQTSSLPSWLAQTFSLLPPRHPLCQLQSEIEHSPTRRSAMSRRESPEIEHKSIGNPRHLRDLFRQSPFQASEETAITCGHDQDRWPTTNEVNRMDTNEEDAIFAFAVPPSLPLPPQINLERISDPAEQSQQPKSSQMYTVITSTPPLHIRNPISALRATGRGGSLGVEYESDSTLFTTQIAPISNSYGPGFVEPRSLFGGEFDFSSLQSSAALADKSCLRMREEGGILAREKIGGEDIFGATWAALQRAKGPNDTMRKGQRRFFFQNPVSSRPLLQETATSSSLLLSFIGRQRREEQPMEDVPCPIWVPSFPDARVPNHRTASAPLRSQLRNSHLFLGSDEPMVTPAAIEEAVAAASTADMSVDANTILKTSGVSSEWEAMEEVEEEIGGLGDVSNHVRFFLPSMDASMSVTSACLPNDGSLELVHSNSIGAYSFSHLLAPDPESVQVRNEDENTGLVGDIGWVKRSYLGEQEQ
ncbi:hypothetical protein FRC20_008752 [Serendipita sp. 405]|nr:hypothetical protein FRC20_008752 [Serendipita sp. 405]